MRSKKLIGAFARDLFRWFIRDMESVSVSVGRHAVMKMDLEMNRLAAKYRGDQISFASQRASIVEKVRAEAEREALDSYIVIAEKTLESLKDRRDRIGESLGYDAKTSILRRAK